tara:strand:- start:592 stop:783 length:192 start_codon:yes stop_codon:yes gene_type:complete
MLEFLKLGIIKGRPRKYDDVERSAQYREIDELRSKLLSDRDIAKKLKVSYFTVAKRAFAETNY